MSDPSVPLSENTLNVQNTQDRPGILSHTSTGVPENSTKLIEKLTPFWHDRLIEAGLILSIALYYIIGNPNLNVRFLSHQPSWLALPFLLIFALLTWYRLPFAVALLPLSLPYYLIQKPVFGHYSFSLVEITLSVCLVVAVVQVLFKQQQWPYWLSWKQLRERLGPLLIPILVFVLAAALSVVIAYERKHAAYAFIEEVLGPLLYLVLAFACLRSRQDVLRLLAALLGTGLVIGFLGMAQYFLFKSTLVVEAHGVRRVHTVYGSANSIGLLFDYVLPIGLALVMARVAGRYRLLALLVCLPIIVVLYLTQSFGSWTAITLATAFIVALSIRNRDLVLIGGAVIVVVLALVLVVFHTPIFNAVLGSHTNTRGVSTLEKRFYLWQSALHMIRDSPWVGYGMDNWLCHYSNNAACPSHIFHYWIKKDPVTGVATGLTDEPDLSHPHNIFLHVWVSMGVFGVLAFAAVLVLFYRLFAVILSRLRTGQVEGGEQLRWMTIGVGAAMLAALVQGEVDSAFLEQDLAFCFWMLVAVLLLLRTLAGVQWRELWFKRTVEGKRKGQGQIVQ